MDHLIPTAAVYAGSLARTYEYRTTGVPTTPAIRWSSALKPGAQITCPILVAQDRVYIADSAGYLNALDASSGDLVWTFPTDWVNNPKKESYTRECEGVTAFCLDEALALGYVASAHDSVYELDLHTGQVVRSWRRQVNTDEDLDEGDIYDVGGIRALYLYREELWLLGGAAGYAGIVQFDRRTARCTGVILIDQGECEYAPAVYLDPTGQADLIFGRSTYNNNGAAFFHAVDLAEGTESFWGEDTWDEDTLVREESIWQLEDEEVILVSEEPDNASLKRVRRVVPGSWGMPFWVIAWREREESIWQLEDEEVILVSEEPDNASLKRVRRVVPNSNEPDNAPPKPVSGVPGSLSLLKSNTPVVDGVLYAPGIFRGEGEDRWIGLLALDPRRGTVKWHVPSFDDAWLDYPMQLVATGDQVFLVSMEVNTEEVKSIDVQTHQPRWTWKAAFPVRHALAADGLLYVLGKQGEMVALETSTGETRWSGQVEGAILKDWSTIDNGTLYLATTDTVYALRS